MTTRLLATLAPPPADVPRQTAFREVFAQLPSGVCVLTTTAGCGPVGITVSSVCSLSLDPLLALACVRADSATLTDIESRGSFTINVLPAGADAVAARFASRLPATDRFAGVEYTWSHGLPVLDAAAAWLTCSVHDLLAGGDHTILIGAVTDMGSGVAEPLVFHRGRYRYLA